MRTNVYLARLFLGIGLFALAHAEGATLYVSTQGNDSNPGTASQPFRTITRAYGAAGAGTTILVAPGTYTDYSSGWGLHLGANGSSGNPIVLRSQTQGAAVIDGQNGSDRNVGVYLDGNYNVVDGFEIKNGPNGGITIWANNNQILNCNIHHNGDAATSSTQGQDGVYSNEGTSGNVYCANFVHNNGRSGNRLDHGLYLCGQNEVVINNVLLANAGSGLQVAGYTTVANLRIYNNVMAHNGTQGIILWQALSGVDIKNNILYANATYGINTSDAHGGGVNIDHNLFFGNGSGAFNMANNGSDVSYSMGSSLNSDPFFANGMATTFDAHLAGSSPAIQAGLNLYSSFTADKAGNVRPASGAWDLGPYERGSSGSSGSGGSGSSGSGGSSGTGTTPPAEVRLPTVTVATAIPTAVLGTTHYGVFRFKRTGSTNAPLTINYSLGGTASKSTDYYRADTGDMPETITIPAGAAAYTMSIAGQDNASQTYPATVTINLLSDPSYHVGTQAFRATLNIAPHVIAAARVKTADGTTLKWHTLAGRTYRVVYRDTPSGPWADLSGEIAATATTTSWTDTTASQVKRRFYHVYLVGGN